MIANTDFSFNNDNTNGGQTIRNNDHLSPVTNEDHIFFRQASYNFPDQEI